MFRALGFIFSSVKTIVRDEMKESVCRVACRLEQRCLINASYFQGCHHTPCLNLHQKCCPGRGDPLNVEVVLIELEVREPVGLVKVRGI